MDAEVESIKIIQIGDTAPDFEAVNQSGRNVKLSQVLESGQKALLVFYPSDNTPGCTKQLCGIRDVYNEYRKLGVTVFGINKGNEKSHLDFINSQGYQFDILVDDGNKIRDGYGAVKKFFANLTTKRGVVLINTDSKVIYTYWGQQDNETIINLLKNT